jgi:hypothetical protein
MNAPLPVRRRNSSRACIAALLVLAAGSTGRAGQLDDGTFQPVMNELEGQTLFAFDNISIPFTRSLKVTMHAPEKYSGNPVLARGKAGEPDEDGVKFYGSIIRVNGKFRMWYVGKGDTKHPDLPDDRALWRPLYAESLDGVNWTKPKLGLANYRGNKDNNVLKMSPVINAVNIKVLYDPEDPDPARRYKMVSHLYWMKGDARHGSLAPYVSPDGLTWKLLIDAKPTSNGQLTADKIILPPVHFEPAGGFYKWDGVYYSSGQNTVPASRPYRSRVARVYRSYDFDNWEPTSAVTFVRTSQYLPEYQKPRLEGEQTHEGISVWNRGNVLLGMYGIWDAGKKWSEVFIHQGFVVSNDGVHFREPAHEFVFIPVGPDGTWDQGGLMQGQGFENVGDKTYIYYGSGDLRSWDGGKGPSVPRGAVGLATLPRDRFGDLSVLDSGEGAPEFVTTTLEAKRGETKRLFVNAEGLGPDASLKVELLTHDEKPLPGYGGEDAAIVTKNGFQTPVTWKGGADISGLPERYRIKATFEGPKKEDIRFSAFYVQPAKS